MVALAPRRETVEEEKAQFFAEEVKQDEEENSTLLAQAMIEAGHLLRDIQPHYIPNPRASRIDLQLHKD